MTPIEPIRLCESLRLWVQIGVAIAWRPSSLLMINIALFTVVAPTRNRFGIMSEDLFILDYLHVVVPLPFRTEASFAAGGLCASLRIRILLWVALFQPIFAVRTLYKDTQPNQHIQA